MEDFVKEISVQIMRMPLFILAALYTYWIGKWSFSHLFVVALWLLGWIVEYVGKIIGLFNFCKRGFVEEYNSLLCRSGTSQSSLKKSQ
jgi:hypothetical protein